MHGDVVRIARNAITKLQVEGDTDAAGFGGFWQVAVVIPTALAKSISRGGKSEAGTENEIEIIRVDFKSACLRFENSEGACSQGAMMSDLMKAHEAGSNDTGKKPINVFILEQSQKLGFSRGSGEKCAIGFALEGNGAGNFSGGFSQRFGRLLRKSGANLQSKIRLGTCVC